MAKIFKNNGVGAINFVWKNAIRWIVAGVICVLWTVGCVLLTITSPLWLPLLARLDGDGDIAREMNVSREYHDNWYKSCLSWCTWAMCRASLWLCSPIIAMLPMKHRANFISEGKKALADYRVKTQVSYYKTFCREGQVNLLGGRQLSQAAIAAIWKANEGDDRAKCIDAGLALTEETVRELCSKGDNTSLLWRYFKKNTPNKTMLQILLDMARQGYVAPQNVLLNLIRQQRPDAALLGKLLTIDQKYFDERVKEILDEYADIDAATYTSDSEEDVIERWSNFCKGKKEISPKAQKYMNHKQYKIYVDTGHNLDFYVLQHLLLSISNENYLKDVVEDEFDNIKGKMLLALKAEYWRYSVYLAVKEAKSILPSNKQKKA
ncbi:MAG: hypothetical protein IJS88_04660 [Alphaproteobacteria bacterium]|nr:hypothetical protein [Alphaproteobacteria bacterium]